jgi:hypothetical protein
VSVVTDLGKVTLWQFPDDNEAGIEAFLKLLSTPNELWVRAYTFTMATASTVLIARQKADQLTHISVDHSCLEYATQLKLVQGLIEAGLEVTVTTSYKGADYIAHEKTVVDSSGAFFTGSTNWSASAWDQINKSIQGVSTDFLAQFKESFEKSIQYAWTHERAFQLMSQPPISYSAQ